MLTGDTSPNSVKNRIKEAVSREDFEDEFPIRFGSEKWKTLDDSKNYYVQDLSKYDDYYSYDNLLDAAALVAKSIYVIEYRQDTNGSLARYTEAMRQSMIDKETGKTTILYTGPDFDSEWNINKPIFRQEVDYGNFLFGGTKNDAKREIAGFLANASHETVGKNYGFDPMKTGLFWNEEVAFIGQEPNPDQITSGGNVSDGYLDENNVAYPPSKGKSYHGRGPFQLSWNYNYGLFSAVVYGNKQVMLYNPEYVLSRSVLGWASAIWFWMTPQYPKTSMHDAIMSNLFNPLGNKIRRYINHVLVLRL